MISVWRWIISVLLMVAFSLQIMSCSPVAPVVTKDRSSLPPDAHDMDKVVNMKGVPLSVTETVMSIRGEQIYKINIVYSDQVFNFESNADHSLTRQEFTFSHAGANYPHHPLPAWFKVKYPHLDYPNIPTTPGFREVSKSDKCSPVGTEVQFAKLMNPGFSDDYIGCDVRTTAQFFASGAGNYMLQISLEDRVVFRCLPPGAAGEKNPLSGEIDANFVVIPKSVSNLVFDLKPGDLIELRGGNHVSSSAIGGSYKQIVFVATSIHRVKK